MPDELAEAGLAAPHGLVALHLDAAQRGKLAARRCAPAGPVDRALSPCEARCVCSLAAGGRGHGDRRRLGG